MVSEKSEATVVGAAQDMARVHATPFEISLKMNCGGCLAVWWIPRGKPYASVGKICKLPCRDSTEHNRRCFVTEVETIISLIYNVAAHVSVCPHAPLVQLVRLAELPVWFRPALLRNGA